MSSIRPETQTRVSLLHGTRAMWSDAGMAASNVIVVDDSAGVAFIRAISKHNCRNTFLSQADRVRYFMRRVVDRVEDPERVVIVLINVDDPNGRPLAGALMPDTDWQPYRDRDEIPFARGLAGRDGIQDFLASVDPEAGEKLQATSGLAIVVLDHSVAEVFTPSDL